MCLKAENSPAWTDHSAKYQRIISHTGADIHDGITRFWLIAETIATLSKGTDSRPFLRSPISRLASIEGWVPEQQRFGHLVATKLNRKISGPGVSPPVSRTLLATDCSRGADGPRGNFFLAQRGCQRGHVLTNRVRERAIRRENQVDSHFRFQR